MLTNGTNGNGSGKAADVVIVLMSPDHEPWIELLAKCGHCGAVLSRRRVEVDLDPLLVRAQAVADGCAAAAHVCERRP